MVYLYFYHLCKYKLNYTSPLFLGEYGPAGGWCWITLDEDNRGKSLFLRMVFFYIPLWFAFCYNGYNVYKVVSFIKRISSDRKAIKLV